MRHRVSGTRAFIRCAYNELSLSLLFPVHYTFICLSYGIDTRSASLHIIMEYWCFSRKKLPSKSAGKFKICRNDYSKALNTETSFFLCIANYKSMKSFIIHDPTPKTFSNHSMERGFFFFSSRESIKKKSLWNFYKPTKYSSQLSSRIMEGIKQLNSSQPTKL